MNDDDYELLNREVAIKDKTPVSQAVEIIMIIEGIWKTQFKKDFSHKQLLGKILETENLDAELEQNLMYETSNRW